MLLQLLKVLLIAALLLLVLVGVGLWSLANYPQPALSLVEKFSGYKVAADTLDLNYSPLSLTADQLNVDDAEGHRLFSAANLQVNADLSRAWNDQGAYWSAQLQDAELDLGETTPETDTEPADQPSAALDLKPLLGLKQLMVNNLTVRSAGSQTQYQLEATRSNPDTLNVSFSMDDTLNVQVEIVHDLGGARDTVSISAESLDLRKLTSGQKTAEDSSETATPHEKPNNTEPTMNWHWLGTVQNLNLNLDITALLLAEQSMNDLKVAVEFERQKIDLKQLSGELLLEGLVANEETENTGKASSQSAQLRITDIDLKGHLDILNVSTDGVDARAKIVLAANELEALLEGDLNVNGSNGNKFSLSLELGDESDLNQMIPDAVRQFLPLKVQSAVSVEEHLLNLTNIDANFGPSDVRGSATLSLDPTRLLLKADLKSQQLSYQLSENAADKKPDAGAQQADNERVLSSEKIDWSFLNEAELDIALESAKLTILEADFADFELELNSKDGTLALQPFGAKFGGGGFNGSAGLELQAEGVAAKLEFTMQGVDLESFGLVSQEQLKGGITEIDLQLDASGQSIADLASTSNGKIQLLVHEAVVQNDSFEIIGSDIFMELLNKLNPFAKSDPTTELECALVYFDVKDGILQSDKSLVMETEKMEIIGDGNIDLTKESLDILLTPSAKQGVGLDVGSMVKFMKLGGTLSSPSPAVDGAGLLKSGASIGAAISTGGLSLLAEKVVKNVASENACRKMLAAIPTSAATQP